MNPLESKTIETAVDLADHPKFKWVGGMMTACGTRLSEGWQLDTWIQAFGAGEGPVPDLDDPATKGCLLDRIRTLSKDESAYVTKFDDGWGVVVWPEIEDTNYYETEGLALANCVVSLRK